MRISLLRLAFIVATIQGAAANRVEAAGNAPFIGGGAVLGPSAAQLAAMKETGILSAEAFNNLAKQAVTNPAMAEMQRAAVIWQRTHGPDSYQQFIAYWMHRRKPVTDKPMTMKELDRSAGIR